MKPLIGILIGLGIALVANGNFWAFPKDIVPKTRKLSRSFLIVGMVLLTTAAIIIKFVYFNN